MSAPAGNQFWKLRSRHGRDKLFKTAKLLWEAASQYFEWCDSNPWIKKEQLKKPTYTKHKNGKVTYHDICEIPTARPYTLSGLCIFLGTNRLYFNDFKESLEGKKDKKSKDFSVIIHAIEEIIYTQKFEGAAVGAFNANIIARDLKLRDGHELTGKDGKPIRIKSTSNVDYSKLSDAALDEIIKASKPGDE